MTRGILLAPAGLIVVGIDTSPGKITVMTRPASATAFCPCCGIRSRSVHSQYQRSLSDLPSSGRAVQIKIRARRFRCRHLGCQRRIFVERLDPTITMPFLRRTMRLEGIMHHLGLALGGRPGERLARRLVIPVSRDTLLRVVRRRTIDPALTPRVVGIDDWAWKKGHRYGTIICDLEQRRIADILPDREAATVTAWLSKHPSIVVIARDRGAGYIQAATQGRPEAVQVADRWHLMENASAAFLGMVKQSMRAIRKAFGTGRVDPTLLTSAELRQYDGWVRREEENTVILTLAKAGISIKEIARRMSRSRFIIRQIVRGGRTDIFRSRTSSLGPFLKQLDAEWTNGCRNGAELWRRLKAAGFLGCSRVIAEWATRRRRDEDASSAAVRPRTTPSARRIARLMTTERSRPSKENARTMAIITEAVPALVVARDLTDRFHQIIQRRKEADLEPWIADAAPSMMAPFASGIIRDQAAVQAALELPWSNGQTEGQNTKLKLVKRQMYGRAKLDLLRARLLGAA